MQNKERMKEFERFEKEVFAEILHDLFGDAKKSVKENDDEKMLELERKLKESERENTLLREKLGTIKQVEWDCKEAEEKIHMLHKEIEKLHKEIDEQNEEIEELHEEIDEQNDYIFELKQSLAAQRKINEVLVLSKADCSDRTSCKKVRWEAD